MICEIYRKGYSTLFIPFINGVDEKLQKSYFVKHEVSERKKEAFYKRKTLKEERKRRK